MAQLDFCCVSGSLLTVDVMLAEPGLLAPSALIVAVECNTFTVYDGRVGEGGGGCGGADGAGLDGAAGVDGVSGRCAGPAAWGGPGGLGASVGAGVALRGVVAPAAVRGRLRPSTPGSPALPGRTLGLS